MLLQDFFTSARQKFCTQKLLLESVIHYILLKFKKYYNSKENHYHKETVLFMIEFVYLIENFLEHS